MKKMIFSVVAIAALSSVAFFHTGNKPTTELTPIQFANIEALASGEGNTSRTCASNIVYTGSYSSMTMYCKTCSYRFMYAPENGYDSQCYY